MLNTWRVSGQLLATKYVTSLVTGTYSTAKRTSTNLTTIAIHVNWRDTFGERLQFSLISAQTASRSNCRKIIFVLICTLLQVRSNNRRTPLPRLCRSPSQTVSA